MNKTNIYIYLSYVIYLHANDVGYISSDVTLEMSKNTIDDNGSYQGDVKQWPFLDI